MTSLGGTALITGASGGLGQAIARALAAHGARILVTARRAEVLEPLAAELGGRAVVADLADRADVERLIDEAADVEILVANAALPASGVLDDFSVGEVDRALEVNLRAPIMLAKGLTPAMTARGHGHVVFISSLAGKVSSSGSSVYSATKFGLRGFASGLRDELRSRGVGVSTVMPGFIRDAGMFADSGTKLPRAVGTRTADDVARAVLRAIERNAAEVEVAPLPVRLGAALGGLAPELVAGLNRRMGGDDVVSQMAEGQRAKR